MAYTPKLEDFMKALETNRVFACEDEHYIGFKYNEPTVYSQDWDDVTLNARGIVFDKATGEIVARPFYKFFNYEELYNGQGLRTVILDKMEACGFKFDRTQPFRVMDKLDGSLGILFYDKYAGAWRVKTGGAFGSDQAVWANQWVKEHITSGLDEAMTYCYEILYDGDVHPISYDTEELVLLGAIVNETGVEVPLQHLRLIAVEQGVRMADVYEFTSFNDVISYAKNLPRTKEGVVVTFQNGFKCKIKGNEFLALQKQFHSITKELIWANYDCEHWDNPFTVEFMTSIPEEMQDMHDYAKHLDEQIAHYSFLVIKTADRVFKMTSTRREAYELTVSCFQNINPKLVGPAMKLYTAFVNGTTEQLQPQVIKMVHQILKP